MSSHPGSTLKEAIELAEYLRDIKYLFFCEFSLNLRLIHGILTMVLYQINTNIVLLASWP